MAGCSNANQEISSGRAQRDMSAAIQLASLSEVNRSRESWSSDSSEGFSDDEKVVRFFENGMLGINDSPAPKTDSRSETELSMQEYETDYACSHNSANDGTDTNGVGLIEYELRSENEGPGTVGESSTTSDSDVHKLKVVSFEQIRQNICDGDGRNSNWESSGSSDVFDPEIPRRDYWTCLNCDNINNRPAFRYCDKCYKVRRDMYQPRIKPRKKRKRKSSPVRTSLKRGLRNPQKFLLRQISSSNDLIMQENDKSGSGKDSVPHFGGIKLDAYSQETKDSGVGSSQATVPLSPSSVHKDSDSSLSKDSAVDPLEFNGVKLASTRETDNYINPFRSGLRQTVDKVDYFPGISKQPITQVVDEIDSVSTLFNADDAKKVRYNQHISTSGYDEVDGFPCAPSQDVDEVDSSQHVSSQGVDEVVCSQHVSSELVSSQDIDEVDSFHLLSSRDIDEVDSLQPGSSQNVDEVDGLLRVSSQNVDEVDGLLPVSSRNVDEVDSLQPVSSQDVVDSSQHVDEVDGPHCVSSQDINEVDNIKPVSNCEDVELLRHISASSHNIQPTSDYVCNETGEMRNVTTQSSDELKAVRAVIDKCLDEVDSVQPVLIQKANETVPVPHTPDFNIVISLLSSRSHSVATQTENATFPNSDVSKLDTQSLCMTCCSKPANGIFVHAKSAHMCCCYKCARKIWKETKRCPMCNCRAVNTVRLFTA